MTLNSHSNDFDGRINGNPYLNGRPDRLIHPFHRHNDVKTVPIFVSVRIDPIGAIARESTKKTFRHCYVLDVTVKRQCQMRNADRRAWGVRVFKKKKHFQTRFEINLSSVPRKPISLTAGFVRFSKLSNRSKTDCVPIIAIKAVLNVLSASLIEILFHRIVILKSFLHSIPSTFLCHLFNF